MDRLLLDARIPKNNENDKKILAKLKDYSTVYKRHYKKRGKPMKKLHLILLSLLAVSLITHCPVNSSGNQPPVDNTMQPPVDNTMQPPVDNMMPPPVDITTVKTIHAHVNGNVADDTTVIALADSITVAEPTYSILEGNTNNIFSINSSTGVISVADTSQITYDAETKANNVHLLKVRARNGSDTTKATEAPLRIVVRGFDGAFITTWKTTRVNERITIPTTGSGYNFTVDWGDSPQPDTTTYMGDATHDYASPNTYTVVITGTFPRIYFANDGDRAKILTVEQWGSTAWSSMADAFHGAINLTVPAVDAPNLTGVTSMASIFQNARVFNQEINHWNTSSIQDMSRMFQSANAFNQNIGDWDTAKVTDMSFMFSQAGVFNQDIGNWNTAMVIDMNRMFYTASAFNQDIGDWNTAKVTNMQEMFHIALSFNQDIGDWNTAKVTNMSNMFNVARAFNQDISTDDDSWNTEMVNNMQAMFQSASAFNQDVSNWNTAMVTNMRSMFQNATSFNKNISGWNTAKVENMRSMFQSASAFNQPIATDGNMWNTAKVTDMSRMFNGATAFNQDISGWNVSEVDTETECTGFATDSGLATNMVLPPFDNTFTACFLP